MSTVSTLDAVLKELTDNDDFHVSTYQNRPFLATIPKFERFKGKKMPLPMRYGNAMGRSAVFSTAQANITATKYEAFELTRAQDYGVHTISGEAADAADGGDTAFVEGLEAEIDSIMSAVADSLESALFRDGTGFIGRVGSLSSTSLTLATVSDVVNFEVGMQLVASASANGAGGALIDSGNTETIAAVNRNSGILRSTSAAWTTVLTALAAGDYLYCEGDRAAKIKGLEAWMPATAPTAGDSFFAVDRSVDTRLAGNRHDGSSSNHEEALIDGQSVAAREGGRVSTFLVNNKDFRALQKITSSKVNYPRGMMNGKSGSGDVAWIGFETVRIQGDYGPIDVLACPKCPEAVAWGLQLDTWSLRTAGPAPKILMRDGSRILRSASSDAYEVRMGYYGQLGCTVPGFNVRVILPTLA